MTLRTLNYGNYGIFLIMGNAGFCPSAVVPTLGSKVYIVPTLHPKLLFVFERKTKPEEA